MSSHRSAAYTEDDHKKYMRVYNGWYRRVNRDGILIKKQRYRKVNKVEIKRRRREKAFTDKLLVIDHYSNGTNKCALCDVNDIDMLTLDHINDDGANHRKKFKSDSVPYYTLIKEGFPSGLQVYCANHNQKKEMERRKLL
jgi:hypothetical protein